MPIKKLSFFQYTYISTIQKVLLEVVAENVKYTLQRQAAPIHQKTHKMGNKVQFGEYHTI